MLRELVWQALFLGSPTTGRGGFVAGTEAATSTGRGPPRKKQAVVLLVDDEPDILEAYSALFEAALDCKVITAESGSAALTVLATTPVDLIVTDYRMPNLNGLQFLARAKDVATGIPSIMVTAYAD